MRNNTTSLSTLENGNYGIQIQYPSDWSVQESKSSGELVNIATFLSPTGNPYPTAAVAIYMDRLHNSATNLNNYAHFVAFTDYENRPSDFHAFRLLELNTNSSILAGKPVYTLIGTYELHSSILAGKPAYTLIGTYELHSSGLQKVMEVGTIIGDKAYSVQYIVDAPKYSDQFKICKQEDIDPSSHNSCSCKSGNMGTSGYSSCKPDYKQWSADYSQLPTIAGSVNVGQTAMNFLKDNLKVSFLQASEKANERTSQ